MCGIAGAINYDKFDLDKVKNSLLHRGPDAQKIFTEKNIALVHTRLAIQDIHNGEQPLHFQNYSIVFNGEIYNHLELRKELSEFQFKSQCDTETLLFMYIKYGEKMFQHIDGMFAFAIWNKETNNIFLARDRAGKKPLYIYQNNQSILFSSELHALKQGVAGLSINSDAIESYLRLGFFAQESTPYKDVHVLKAGHYCNISPQSHEIHQEPYFDIQTFYKKNKSLSFEQSLTSVDNALHKSIRDRISSSDLEVGAFLSGGIDSSLIVAIASQYNKNIKTFTVKFDGAYDESHLARLTAQKYSTSHTELEISVNLKNDIENILRNYGQPFMDSSAIPSYYVSQAAKEHVTVVLNGDGADELFAGYRRYVPAQSNIMAIVKNLSFLLPILPKPQNKKSIYNYLHRLLAMSKKKDLDFYLSSTTDIFEDEYSIKSNLITNNINEYIKSINLDPLSKMLFLDFNLLMFSDLLIKMDIATMSHSLEGRSPFLSKYMLELAPTISSKYKVKGTQTKYILRELARKYLSPELINQPKRGFEVPLKAWVEKDLKENIFEALQNSPYSANFIDNKFIKDLLYKKSNISPEKRAKMLWSLYCLEIWKKNN